MRFRDIVGATMQFIGWHFALRLPANSAEILWDNHFNEVGVLLEKRDFYDKR